MLRRGSAGSGTGADHLTVLEEAITAIPPRHQRRLMVTCDGAGALAVARSARPSRWNEMDAGRHSGTGT